MKKDIMTEKQIQILSDYHSGKMPRGKFLQEFGKEIEDVKFIKEEIKASLKTKNEENIERAISLMLFAGNYNQFIDELNILLLDPNHRNHQLITKTIQDLGNPKSVPFIKKVLETNFDYLEYTCSDSDVIAKWFSWALFSIGTDSAINVIKEYARSEDNGIRNEMIYRLNKLT